jgi:hypothetical protein
MMSAFLAKAIGDSIVLPVNPLLRTTTFLSGRLQAPELLGADTLVSAAES